MKIIWMGHASFKIISKKGFVIYDTADQRQAMKKALTNLGQENTPKKIRMYLAIISKYKNGFRSRKFLCPSRKSQL